jgi:general secretion pathway protein D
MKRTMELLALFDSDSFTNQRVRLYEILHGRPSDLAKQLESVFKAFSLSDKVSAVKFIPVDRINTLIAVASNPGIFEQVDRWLEKLDIPVKAPAGAVDNYVYRLKYRSADMVAIALMALYSGNPMALMALASMNNNMAPMGVGFAGVPSMGGGGYGMGGYGSGYSGMGYGNMGYGNGYGNVAGYGNMGYGNMGYGNSGYNPMAAMGAYGNSFPNLFSGLPGSSPSALTSTPGGTAGGSPDQTGSYLSPTAAGGATALRVPHIIPNPFDNTLLIQCTPEEWEQISRLLSQLDVAPRQILVEAKIYEVNLTGDLQYGVNAYLQNKGAAVPAGYARPGQAGGFLASSVGQTLNLTGALLVGHSRVLLAALTALESVGKAKTISAPSLLATDSIPATMNVGESVPTATSQALVSGVQENGTSPFAQTIANTNTGVTLNVLARINSSGIITLMINQQVSTPEPPSGPIASPSFSTRSFQTQITLQDGDTVAIGGIIQEEVIESSGGIPFLNRIPVIGAAFGAKSRNTARTELVVFFTPHVVYDSSSLADATDDLKSQMKHLKHEMKSE